MSFIANLLLLSAVALPVIIAWRAVRRPQPPTPPSVPVEAEARPSLNVEVRQ